MKSRTEYKKSSDEKAFYSMQRMDLLIISISTVGIIGVIQMMKYALEKSTNLTTSAIASIVLFVIAIVLNFVSQWTGYRANQNASDWAKEGLDVINKRDGASQENVERYEKKIDSFSKATDWINAASAIAMIAGIILAVYFLFSLS